MIRLVLSLALLTLPAHALAQGGDAIRIASGFTPDPARAPGRTSGANELHALGPSCRGFVGNAPDHILHLQTGFAFLRVFLLAAQDLSLVIYGPDGRWRCATSHDGRAALQEGRWTAGAYQVWVGSMTQNQRVEYELQVTEFRSVGPGEEVVPGGRIDVGLDLDAEEGRFRDRRIRRGFLPDPIEDGATAGGDIDVRLLGARCRGYVTAQPSHVLTLRNEFDYLRVQLGGARGTATIVLSTPGGRYLCSSPDDENAFISRDAWAEGVYRVWIGSRSAVRRPPYRICYTEARLAEAGASCGADAAPRPP